MPCKNARAALEVREILTPHNLLAGDGVSVAQLQCNCQQQVCVMITSALHVTSTKSPPPAAPAQTTADGHAFSFHDILSAMNPLQYLPVVGTIYRAMTGDVIAEPVRDVGSLLVSGLLGGPIGLVTYIASTIAEKITGVDPEKIVSAQFNGLSRAADVRVETPTTATANVQTAAASTQLAFTPQQLAAYGIRSDASGKQKLGGVEGADALNAMELVRLDKVATAYAANQTI
jgi:hypothetical protein